MMHVITGNNIDRFQYIQLFKKYIESIIQPKYPDIIGFGMRLEINRPIIDHFGDFKYMVSGRSEFIITIDFQFKERPVENEIEFYIRHEVVNMRRLFDVGNEIAVDIDYYYI
jgi:hypothetical protein